MVEAWAIVVTYRSLKMVSYYEKGTGLRRERPSTTNLLCDCNKSFNLTQSSEKWGYSHSILMINNIKCMFQRGLKSYTNARNCVTILKATCESICLFFNRDLFAVISYGCCVSLTVPFVSSSEILKREKQWMLSKRCLVSWWECFDHWLSKQILKNFLGALSQVYELYLNEWR